MRTVIININGDIIFETCDGIVFSNELFILYSGCNIYDSECLYITKYEKYVNTSNWTAIRGEIPGYTIYHY